MLTFETHDFNREVRDGSSSIRFCSPIGQTRAIPDSRTEILVAEICLSKIELNAGRSTKRTMSRRREQGQDACTKAPHES